MAGAVSFGLAGLGFMGYHKIKNDPTLVIMDKVNNPSPYLHVRQNENLKLYAVNQKFEDNSLRKFF
jgi:hypothetical protein